MTQQAKSGEELSAQNIEMRSTFVCVPFFVVAICTSACSARLSDLKDPKLSAELASDGNFVEIAQEETSLLLRLTVSEHESPNCAPTFDGNTIHATVDGEEMPLKWKGGYPLGCNDPPFFEIEFSGWPEPKSENTLIVEDDSARFELEVSDLLIESALSLVDPADGIVGNGDTVSFEYRPGSETLTTVKASISDDECCEDVEIDGADIYVTISTALVGPIELELVLGDTELDVRRCENATVCEAARDASLHSFALQVE